MNIKLYIQLLNTNEFTVSRPLAGGSGHGVCRGVGGMAEGFAETSLPSFSSFLGTVISLLHDIVKATQIEGLT